MSGIARKMRPFWDALYTENSLALLYAGLLLLWLLAVGILPQLALLLLSLNLLALMLVAAFQLYSAQLPRQKMATKALGREAFVSIHVPTYNEPPEIVINTLKALQRLDYEQYEVIVLDNNTADPKVWQPVEAFCASAGKPFRFRHIDKLEGYKAGALNVCYEMSNSQTDYILVIDADYRVAPRLLQEALSHFVDDTVALVQFPQAYLNTGTINKGMESEYNHFFEVYMNMANRYNCVLSTGTVSVIRKTALEQVGLWSGSTITEDCELGLRLHQCGYRGVYVPKPLGKGLMPTDLKALKVQRERWVFGNMQTLMKFLSLPKRKLCMRQCAGILTQLTAWFNFLFLPVLAAVSGMVAYVIAPRPEWLALGSLGLLSVWSYLVLKFIFFRLAFRYHATPWQSGASAFLVHIGMAWEGATSWLRALCGENIRFKRTNKFLNLIKGAQLEPNLLLSALLLITAVAAFIAGAYGWGVLSLLAAPLFTAVFYVNHLTQNTLKLTRQLQQPEVRAKAA